MTDTIARAVHILDRPVSKGRLWGPGFTWREAIDNHAEMSASGGDCRFMVYDGGVWIESDAPRRKVYRTRLPKGAEAYARAAIKLAGLAQSPRDSAYWVSPRYA